MSIVISGTDGITPLKSTNGSAGAPSVTGTDTDTGLFFGTNEVNIATGGTERVKVDSSGRLLVGTSTARTDFFNGGVAVPIQVEGTGTPTAGISIVSNPGAVSGNTAVLVLGKTRGSSVGSTDVVQSGDELGVITFQGCDGTDLVEGARITAVVDNTPGSNDMPGRLAFSVTQDGSASPTERMRIANVGTCAHFATNDTVLGANSSAASGNTVRLFSGSYSATAVFTGAESFRIWSSGDVNNQNNSYTGISDIKLKENIEDAPSQWLDIKALRVRKYNLKQGSNHKQIGLIAQELEASSPGLVEDLPDLEGGSTTKSVKYSVLYMKAVKALQEAMERIETLEAKVAALEGGAS